MQRSLKITKMRTMMNKAINRAAERSGHGHQLQPPAEVGRRQVVSGAKNLSDLGDRYTVHTQRNAGHRQDADGLINDEQRTQVKLEAGNQMDVGGTSAGPVNQPQNEVNRVRYA